MSEVTTALSAIPIDDTLPWFDRTDDSWWAVEPELLPIAEIGFVQRSVTIAGLLRHAALSELGYDPPDRWPRAVRHRGVAWIVDGHHRITVALLLGATAINARVRTWPWDRGQS